jgi:two-component system phosphate regulon response regulator PhoB
MPKVLFVEDDPDQIALYQYAFMREGIDLSIASDFAQALAASLEERPDLILLDLLLANEYGIDVLQQLKRDVRTSAIPVLIFTNFENTEAREKAEASGAIDYVIKSQVTPKEMAERVCGLLKIEKEDGEKNSA